MVNTVFRQTIPASRKGIHLPTHHSISRVPVECEVGRLNGSEDPGRFPASGRIAGELIFNDKKKSLLADNLGGSPKLLIDGCAIWSHIIEPPEIEAADFVRLELLGQRDAAFDDFVLVFVGNFVGAMHILFGAILRLRGSRPVNLEQRTRNVGNLQFVLGQDLLRLSNFGIRRSLEVFAPHLAEFDPLQAEVIRDHRACVIEILRDFIGDNGDLERRLRCRHAKEWMCRAGCSSYTCSCNKTSS